MKKTFKKVSFGLLFMFITQHASAQENNQVYLGLGIGLDYGGIGAKVEYLPIKNVGVFGSLGYNLLNVGWNVGATYKIMPDKRYLLIQWYFTDTMADPKLMVLRNMT